MIPVHEYFREHSKVYYRWHTFGFIKMFHWLLLVLFLAGTAAGVFLYGIPATPTAKAAVSMTALTSGGAGPGLTSANTASISPSSNALVLLWVENRLAGGTPGTPTASGNSLTWTQVATVTFNTTGTPLSRLTLFKALGASPTSGAVTIDFGGATQGNCVWSIAEYTGVSTSTPVVQYATNNADSASSLTATLSTFGSANNATAAGFGADVNVAINNDSGWTEIHDFSSVALPGYSRLETQWYNGNDTSAVGTMSSGSADMAGIAVEIGAGGGGTADTCYWVGDTNPAVWNDATHWANSSGGTGGTCNGGFVPDSDDDVIFDGNGTNEVTVNADIDINSLTMTSGYTGTFDNATNDKAVAVAGNVTMDNARTDMGDATWTVGGSFDNQHVTTFNKNASTVTMTGTGKEIISNTRSLHNLTIANGASVSQPTSSAHVQVQDGIFRVIGTYSIASGKNTYVHGADLKVSSSGSITGDGTLKIAGTAKISQKDGVIDVANLHIFDDHGASYPIIAATYESADVQIYNNDPVDYGWVPSAGTYTFNGNVTFTGNTVYTNVYTIDNSVNNPNFVFKKHVSFNAGAASTINWTKGTGSITFAGSTTTTLTDSRTNKSDLGKIEVNGTNKTLNLGSSIIATSINVHSGQTLGLGSSGYTTTITGSGTASNSPFMISGTLDEGTDSTVLFTGTNNTTIPSETFHNLEIKPTSGSPTYDVSTGTLSNPSAPSSMSAGTTNLSSGRHIVRSFTGSLYTFINNSGSCEIWKSTNGLSWSQQDANNNPACSGGDAFAVAIDGNDYIHLVYYDDGMVSPTPLKYITFNTLNDTFGTEETITGFSGSPIGNVGSVDIAIDSNNKPHVAYSYITTSYPAHSYIHYSNKVSASWVASAVGGKNANSHHIDIEINEDNIPEVYYILQGSGNAELGGAVGNANNATSFTHGLTAMAVNSTHPGLSAVIDNSGYTWLAYVDTNGYISLIKGDDAVFSPSTVTTNSNIGRAPSAAVVGSQIYVYYVNDQDDIAYDTYNGSTWGGENVVVEGTLQDVRVKWSYLYNNFGTSVLDFIYSDGTNIYWTGQAFGAGGNGTLKTNNYFTLGNGTNAVTLDVNTTDVNVDVDGTFTIASNATVVASDTAYMKVAGTYTASGTFTHSSGTLTFDGTSTQSITCGTSSYYNITSTNSLGLTFSGNCTATGIFTHQQGGSTLTFQAGSTYAFASIAINGATNNLVTMASSSPTNQWYFNVSASTPTVTYVHATDSNASGGSTILADDGTSANGGNNINWKFFTGVTITGTIYTDEAVTPLDCTTPRTVALSVNGATPETTTCSNSPSNGSFAIYIDTPTSGDVLTTYIDGATEKATTVTRADGTDMTINLFQNRAVIHHEDTGPITNANIGAYDYDDDTDILYTSNSNNLTLNDGFKLFIADGTTYTPGGTITTSPSSDSATTDGDIYIDSTATLNMQANALSIGGDYVNDGTFSYSSTQTTTLTATTTGHSLDSGTSSWYNLTTSGTGGWITSTDTLNINGNLTLATGTFDNATNDATINVTGNVTMDNTQTDMGDATWTVSGDFDNYHVTTFNCDNSTLVMNGTGKYLTSFSLTRSLKHLTIDGAITIPATSGSVACRGTATINGTLTINNSSVGFWMIYSPANLKVTSTGRITGTGLLRLDSSSRLSQQDGVIDVDSMYIAYPHSDANSTQIVSATYSSSNVIIYNRNWATDSTFTPSAGTYTFEGNVLFKGADMASQLGKYTINNATNNPNFVFKGNVTVDNGYSELIWTKGTGTITFSGTSAQTADFLDKAVEDIVISNTSATVSLTGNGVTTDGLTVDSGATFDLNGENLSYPSSQGTYNDGTIRLQGGETLTNVANLDTDSGTVTYYGDNGGGGSPFTIKDFGTTDYYNLTFNATLGTDVFRPADTLTVANDLTITQGTFDNATNDENINVTGNVTMDNTQTDMGDGTWTVSGNWDSKDATTLSGGAGTLVMNGTNKSYSAGSSNNTPNSLTIASGASITQAGSFYPIYNGGTFQVDGTYTVPSGKSSFVSWTTLRVSSTGKITGDGSMIVSATDISQQDGTIDVATLALYRVSDSDPIVPATFDSATVAFANATDTTSRTWSPATGTYTFNGNVTISGNIHNASTFTIDNSVNNPNFVFKGNVTFTNGTSTLNWTKGTGTITVAGTSTQSLDFLGKTVEDINITNTSADVSITNDVTCDSLSASDNASIKVTAGKTITTSDISNIGGSASKLVTLRSSTTGSQWYLNVSGTPVVSYVDVRDSNASGGSEIMANDGTSIDSTNNINWRFLPHNNPTNDSLTFVNPYGGTGNSAVADNLTEWTFRAKVSDADSLTDIDYVLLRLANSADSTQPYEALVFKWDRVSDTFSEITDTQNAFTLTSTSGDSTSSGNQWTLDFKFKVNSNFAATGTNYAAELYSADRYGGDDTDNYANFYKVDALSIALNVSPAIVDFADLIPTETITKTSIATITTNYPNGYSLSAHDAVTGNWSALLHTDSVTRILDYAGTIASPTLWNGTGLGICVYQATGKNAKWGTGTTETDPNNKYAGVPAAATVVHSKTGTPTIGDKVYIGYKLSVGIDQKSGDYSGVITYTATGVLQ